MQSYLYQGRVHFMKIFFRHARQASVSSLADKGGHNKQVDSYAVFFSQGIGDLEVVPEPVIKCDQYRLGRKGAFPLYGSYQVAEQDRGIAVGPEVTEMSFQLTGVDGKVVLFSPGGDAVIHEDAQAF